MNENTAEHHVGEYLREHGATLATAESCSGGLIAHRLTNVSGSSAYIVGGIVAYSNTVKEGILGVSGDDLATHGAVSEPVARQMAEGARRLLSTDWSVAVTGIAGPTGGTPEKPVGLVFIAVAGPNGTVVTRNQFAGTREEIKGATAERALQMLWELLRDYS